MDWRGIGPDVNKFQAIKCVLYALAGTILFFRLVDWDKKKTVKFLFTGLYFLIVLSLEIGFTPTLDEPYKSAAIIMILSLVFFRVVQTRFDNMLITVALIVGLSHIAYLLSLFISLVLAHVFSEPQEANLGTMVVLCAVEAILLLVFNKIRIRFSMTQKRRLGGIGLVLSGVVIILYSLFREGREGGFSNKGFWLLLSGIILCFIGLMYWMKREVSLSNHDVAQNRLLEQLQHEIESLTQTHDSLSAYIHRENKRLPAIQQAVEVIVHEVENQELKEKALSLLLRITQIRQELAQEIDRNAETIPLTGMPVIDAILAFMRRNADRLEIQFDLEVTAHPSGVISSEILETLLADLTENAIYAVSHTDTKDRWIRVSIQNQNDVLVVEVADNGVPFAISTLARMGNQAITTHTKDGGGGYGYLHIFSLIKELGASLIIIEKTATNYSEKNISIQFDQQGMFVIYSDRVWKIKNECELLGRKAHVQGEKILIGTNESLE